MTDQVQKPETNREALRRMAREAREELAALPPSRRPSPPREPTAWIHRQDRAREEPVTTPGEE
jgi:hypothetical protein